jgi:hypothetical protein
MFRYTRVVLFSIALSTLGDSTVEAFARQLPLHTTKPKYMQGMVFSDGALFYGTNRGEVAKISPSLTRHGEIIDEWCVKISSRTIKSIDEFSDSSLFVTSDTVNVNDETSRTYVIDKTSGQVLQSMSWNDTTLAQYVYKNTWYRCNVMGDMYFQSSTFPFKVKRSFCLPSDGTLQCGFFLHDKFFTLSLGGTLDMYNIHTFEHLVRHETSFSCPTALFVQKPAHLTDTYFVYAGDVHGKLYFGQMNQKILTQHAVRNVVTPGRGAITHISGNSRGPVLSFSDSSLVAVESMSYQIYFDVLTKSFLSQERVCSSHANTFFIMNENTLCVHQHTLHS